MIRKTIILVILLIYFASNVYARQGLILTTSLNKEESPERPAEYSTGEELVWNFGITNTESFTTNVCFYMDYPNNQRNPLTDTVVNAANYQYCPNHGNPLCIRLDSIVYWQIRNRI